MALDMSLVGKPVEELTPAELAQLDSQLAAMRTAVTARQKEVSDKATTVAFSAIIEMAVEAMKDLAWQKMPPLSLTPTADGLGYICSYVVKKSGKKSDKKSGSGTRTVDSNGGKITVAKIVAAMGELSTFEVAGKTYESAKEVIKDLINPTSKESEANHCWEISQKGISGSDIMTTRHAKEIILNFKDGTRITVEDAVAQLKAAREAAEEVTPEAEEAATPEAATTETATEENIPV